MAEPLPPFLMRAGRGVLQALPQSLAAPIRARWRHWFAWLTPHEQRRLRKAFASVGATGIDFPDINHLLHFFRGQALGGLPRGVDHFVSVGCAGTWYFEWVNEKCAPKKHTGIEFYTPRPADLPANAHWIANTAGNMEAVPDATADVLFSGQNIEHLWAHDVANFLLEAHRVLKPGGLLVVDSPNRLITAKLNWSHPEHTIEFTADEAVELLSLAGFDVTRQTGMWLCETDAGRVLPFAEITMQGEWPITRRAKEARGKLDASFIWWFEARRADRAPDAAALRERIAQIHAVAWPERLNRLLTSIGKTVDRNGETWFDSEGRAGALTFGPYTALPPGRHELTMTVAYPEGVAEGAPGASIQVSGGNSHDVLVRRDVPAAPPGQPVDVTLPFELADTTFQLQFVVVSPAGTRTLAKKAVTLRSPP